MAVEQQAALLSVKRRVSGLLGHICRQRFTPIFTPIVNLEQGFSKS